VYAIVGLIVQRHLVRAGLATHVYQQNMLGQDCLLHAWTIAWDQHALATAPCTVADANIFHPERGTLFYSDHLLGLAVLTWPLRLVTDDALLVHNVLTIAAPILDALALYALAFDLTGSVVAALIGGLIYGFAPLRFVADACQIQMTAAWWLPLALLGARRAVRGDGARWGVVGGLALLAQGLSGIYLTAFFLPFWGLAHVAWWRRHPRAAARGGWTALVATELVAVALLMPTALAYRGVQAHLGASRSPFLNAILSLHWGMLAEHVPWMTTLALVVLALARPYDLPGRLRRERLLFVAIVAGALVLGLGPAMGLPWGLGTVPGPYRLLVELPGFTALRVPARMLHVALLGASVLAAGGVVVVRTVAWRAPALATALVLLGLAIESRPRTPGILPIARPAELDRVYRWLAHEKSTTFVELPIDPFGLTTAIRQYASTLHWQRALHGTSGVEPPLYRYAVHRLDRFPDPDVVADLAALDVRHAVVHLQLLAPDARARLDAAVRARRVLKPRWSHGPTAVYALRPGRRAPRRDASDRPLDRRGWHATASSAASLAPLAIDDDLRTAWASWGDLDASVQRAWYDPRPILDRWKAFADAGPATLTIDLGTPATISSIRLGLGGSDPMLLPELHVEVSIDDATWTPLYVRPYPDIRALVDAAADIPMAATAPAPTSARWIRLIVGAYETHVHDVQVFTRSTAGTADNGPPARTTHHTSQHAAPASPAAAPRPREPPTPHPRVPPP
jgi:hypothetical protein